MLSVDFSLVGYRRGEMVQVDYFLFAQSSGIYTLAFGTHFPAFSSHNNNNRIEQRFCLAWLGLARPSMLQWTSADDEDDDDDDDEHVGNEAVA